MIQSLFSRIPAILMRLFRPLPMPIDVQAAALCWRRSTDGEIEILTITTRRSGRWSIPKGGLMKNKSEAESAAQEAWEEAGVTGVVSDDLLGEYILEKQKLNRPPDRMSIRVYALAVRDFVDDFPEAGLRKRAWRSQSAAAAKVNDPRLARLISGFNP